MFLIDLLCFVLFLGSLLATIWLFISVVFGYHGRLLQVVTIVVAFVLPFIGNLIALVLYLQERAFRRARRNWNRH